MIHRHELIIHERHAMMSTDSDHAAASIEAAVILPVKATTVERKTSP